MNSTADSSPRAPRSSDACCLVTGGAGFIGCNLADALVRAGSNVTILDNLERPGARLNRDWLRSRLDGDLRFIEGDVRDRDTVDRAVADADVVYHLAGQTAVTTSVLDPRADFESNALGTLNVLEAARNRESPPTILYASTNKVYGSLATVQVVEEASRFRFRDLPHGVDETHPLEFHSPYGCSKGVADQYALDYARIYGLPTIVFRQSCVYGPRQLGSEEQGWVAWLAAAAVLGRPVTIFGSGKQVRDLLYVDDVVDAYLRATDAIDRTAGQVYNIGGGAERSLSVWHEFAPVLGTALGRRLDPAEFRPARPGDQHVFFCDTRRARSDFGWQPTVDVAEGLTRLLSWIRESDGVFAGAGR